MHLFLVLNIKIKDGRQEVSNKFKRSLGNVIHKNIFLESKLNRGICVLFVYIPFIEGRGAVGSNMCWSIS